MKHQNFSLKRNHNESIQVEQHQISFFYFVEVIVLFVWGENTTSGESDQQKINIKHKYMETSDVSSYFSYAMGESVGTLNLFIQVR